MPVEDRYSDPKIAQAIVTEIRRSAEEVGRPVHIMEVCGTHTVALRQHGIHSLLPPGIRLISGPGCPVCVTVTGYIDNALLLARSGKAIIATFGDMLKVPGSNGSSLASVGDGKVRIIYSPSELPALATASELPVVFLGIGFETTTPTVAAAFAEASEKSIDNLLCYTAFKTVPPALKFILSRKDIAVDALLLPGHVSVITGRIAYRFLETPPGVASAIAGFEPIDMLLGIRSVMRQLAAGTPHVDNQYPRAVREDGNPRARALVERMLEPCDDLWRGLGMIPESGLRFQEEFARFDAARAFDLPAVEDKPARGCRCGEVIMGKALPTDCGLFGTACTPDRPVGPCMVSSEGTCAAYLRYGS